MPNGVYRRNIRDAKRRLYGLSRDKVHINTLNALVVHRNPSDHSFDLINANMFKREKYSLRRKCIERERGNFTILCNIPNTRSIHNIIHHRRKIIWYANLKNILG